MINDESSTVGHTICSKIRKNRNKFSKIIERSMSLTKISKNFQVTRSVAPILQAQTRGKVLSSGPGERPGTVDGQPSSLRQ
jgi:hypothetical protein